MSTNQASSRKFSFLPPSTRMAPNSTSIHAALKVLSGIGTCASPSFLSASCIHLLKSLLARLIFRQGDISLWWPPLAHGQGVRIIQTWICYLCSLACHDFTEAGRKSASTSLGRSGNFRRLLPSSSRPTMSSEPFRFKRRTRVMDWTQVEERIVEDDRNKWDRKAAAEQLRIVPDGL